ncbi:MAG: IS630 family transposase [Desulfobacterales bacterium]|nr:IS630 family transposase [Desulfobacterales bacterium]
MARRKEIDLATRERVVKSVRSGSSPIHAAKILGVDYSTVYRWVKSYEKKGKNGLKRKPRSGRPRLGSEEKFKKLIRAVKKPASKFGYKTDLWNCTRILHYAKKHLKLTTSRSTINRRLLEAKLSYKVPEKSFVEANVKTQKDWIENHVPEILEKAEEKRAILYFLDEANISLSPFLGKTWSRKGKPIAIKVTGGRGSISAISAISKAGLLQFSLHKTRIASDQVIRFLKLLLEEHKRRHLVVVLDGASPHRSKKTKAFIESQKRLHVFFLPPYSPNFNPDEKVWAHLKHIELTGHKARTKDQLERYTRRSLQKIQSSKDTVKGIFFRCHIASLLT